jgi:hypothetical protein
MTENPAVKHSRWIERGLVALTLVLGCHTAYAFNRRSLEYSPIQYFTDEDWRLLEQAVDQALGDSRKGDKHTWNNPDSGNSGSVTNLGFSGEEGRECTRPGEVQYWPLLLGWTIVVLLGLYGWKRQALVAAAGMAIISYAVLSVEPVWK